MKKILIIFFAFTALVSCTEPMKIEPQEGPQLLGVIGSFTDEVKKHTLKLSRTTDFYDTLAPELISDATIFLHDGIDTVWYEETEEKGVYQTVNEVAGIPNHTYFLSIDLPEYEGGGHYYAQSTMHQNVEKIDSIRIKKYQIANVLFNNVLGLYPYFQSLKDENTYYMIKAYVNDSIKGGEKITNCGIYNLGGMSGWYVNGKPMATLAGEMPVWSFGMKISGSDTIRDLNRGDTVRMDLLVIPYGYASYVSEISNSNGSNPLFGTPSNVSTNIGPEGTASGYFYAASLKSISIIY